MSIDSIKQNNKDSSKINGVLGRKLGHDVSMFLLALLLSLIFKTFFFQPFHIPSGSMKPGLLVGDYIFVNKMSYGYSKYSLPFQMPLIPNRIFYSQPKRGDPCVFVPPNNQKTFYIKRIIGVPGDKVEIKNTDIYINNEKLDHTFNDIFFDKSDEGVLSPLIKFDKFIENNQGAQYNIMYVNDKDNSIIRESYRFEVGQDEFFVMGDNRDNSMDSRFKQVGFIPKENLVGKAKIIFCSIDKSRWSLKTFWKVFRFERFFNKIN